MASQSQEKEAKIEDFNCAECSKRFNTHTSYLTHMKTKHGASSGKPTNLEVAGTTEVRVKELDERSDKAVKTKVVVSLP